MKKSNCLIVGRGSIGERHAHILANMGYDVAFISDRAGSTPFRSWRYEFLNQAISEYSPSYVVICNETRYHKSSLLSLVGSGYSGTILIEKPICLTEERDQIQYKENIFVGYQLRCHPLISSLLKTIRNEQIEFLNASVGQYLPDWRPERNFREIYSAKAQGGGVLYDLSHEIDLVLFLAGMWRSCTGLVSSSKSLDIESESIANLVFDFESNIVGQVHLNYLERMPRRSVEVQTDKATYQLDFIGQSLKRNGEMVLSMNVDRNLPYRIMHESLLNFDPSLGYSSNLCSVEDGLRVVRSIAALQIASSQRIWVENDFDL